MSVPPPVPPVPNEILGFVEPREKYMNRGRLMMKNCRLHKAVKQADAFATEQVRYLQPAIERSNQKFAVRMTDVIHVGAKRKKERIIKGRGQYKKWTGDAVCRAAFGSGFKRAVAKRRRLKGKRKEQVHRTVYAQSVRSIADFNEGGHKHVTDLRKCVSLKLMSAEVVAVESMPAGDLGGLEISFDESDHRCFLSGILGVAV